ncbi:F-box/kelch-repeat protein At2g44130-like [Musa acuminata AAA Group]|uniref:F-box/kelch-repeat protein At2g44130-like n=1 Tax=Musa acuminata AAA Group TaxID=214697 RepID=UPI0031DF3564
MRGREKRGRGIEGEECHKDLIPRLPDDIALDCLARVPLRFHPSLRLVCPRWRDLVTAPSFHRHRERIGVAEDLIFLVQAVVPVDKGSGSDEGEEKRKGGAAACRPPVYGLSAYNATLGSWHRVVTPEQVPLFAQVAAVGREVVLLGGWDRASLEPTAEVRVLDLATGGWRRGAAMKAARSFFACAAVEGRVYVAGGHDGQKNALRSAESYDPAVDAWSALPEMGEERDECRGVAAGGRFWAVSGYGTEGQGRFVGAAEWYDAEAGTWTREEGLGEAGGATCVWVSGGRMWSLEGGGGVGGVREYEGSGKGWREVAPLPGGMRPCAAAAAVSRAGERVFVVAAQAEAVAEAEVGGGGHRGWILEVGPQRWTRVVTPVGFTGFVFSAAAVRI